MTTIEMKAIEIGTIVVRSWGFEQTNIDFYEVVRLTGKFAIIRHLKEVRTETPQAMAGTVIPLPGQFDGPEIRRKLSTFCGAPVVHWTAQSCLTVWDGQPERFTAYA